MAFKGAMLAHFRAIAGDFSKSPNFSEKKFKKGIDRFASE
jgi:hypothetical protein